MEEKSNILKSNTKNVKLENKTDGVQATHSYSTEELDAFCEHINFYLSEVPELQEYLPIKEGEHLKLFDAVGDGILLCKMINLAQPGTIEERAINKKKPLNIFKINENLNLAISSSKAIGCKVVNIFPELITEKREHIILGLFWQVIKAQMLGNIDLLHHPFLIRLKQDNEELEDLLKLPKDKLLLRWFNYHLKNAGHNREVQNFDKDLEDAENYTILLNQLDSQKCDLSGLQSDQNERAKKVINDSQKLGVPRCIQASDITKKRTKLNQLFLAHIFNTCPGLTAEEAEIKEAAEAAGLIDDDNPDQSREERVYAQWINSMGIDDVFINNLILDLNDGVKLCKVLNHMEPGTIEEKKISNKVQSRIYRVQNSNMAIDGSKKQGAQLVGVGGVDIVDGKKKLVCAVLWQLMRKNMLDQLGKLKEEDLLAWANSRVDSSLQVKNLKDKSLQNCQFFFKLCDGIEKGIVDWDLVTKSETEEDIMNNCKYAISCARKLGATVYLVWEHIRDVNPKFLLTLVASIKSVADKK